MASVHADTESLSALFDGELRGDAARFATRRLHHDADWQGRVERWQLIGDMMRGERTLLAAPGFADRVSRAVAGEQEAVAEAPRAGAATAGAAAAAVPRRRMARWSALAVAASVAVAVVLVRPFDGGPASPAPAVAIAPAPASAPVPAPAPAPVVETPRTVAAAVEPRAPRAGVARAGERAHSAARRTVVRTAAEPVQAIAVAATPAAAQPVRPFAPPPVEDVMASRPWPRATLPALGGGAAFTASHGQAPSFFPFEPRVEPRVEPRADVIPPAPAPTPAPPP